MLAPSADLSSVLRRLAGDTGTGDNEARIVATQTVIAFANLFEAAVSSIRAATDRADPQTRIALLRRLAERANEHANTLNRFSSADTCALAAQWRALAKRVASVATPDAVPSPTTIEFELHRASREWKRLRVLAEQAQGARRAP